MSLDMRQKSNSNEIQSQVADNRSNDKPFHKEFTVKFNCLNKQLIQLPSQTLYERKLPTKLNTNISVPVPDPKPHFVTSILQYYRRTLEHQNYMIQGLINAHGYTYNCGIVCRISSQFNNKSKCSNNMRSNRILMSSDTRQREIYHSGTGLHPTPIPKST